MKATKGGNFKAIPLPEPQTALARCYAVIDIGTIPNIYKGEMKGYKRDIYIIWEFPTLLAVFNDEKGEEPFVIGQQMTASTNEKSNLAILISRWRNKPFTPIEQEGFDPSTMIGKTGYISFIHKRKKDYEGKEILQVTNENTNLKFNGIMPKPKDIEAPPNRNPYLSWDWDKVAEEGFEKHKATFEKIPKWLQRKIAESKEFKQYAGGYKVEGASDDDDDDAGTTAAPKEQPKKIGEDW